jgi:hypothetical protein
VWIKKRHIEYLGSFIEFSKNNYSIIIKKNFERKIDLTLKRVE